MSNILDTYSKETETRELKIRASIYTEGFKKTIAKEPWVNNFPKSLIQEVIALEDIAISLFFNKNQEVYYSIIEIAGLPFREISKHSKLESCTGIEYFNHNYELLSILNHETSYESATKKKINLFYDSFFNEILGESMNDFRNKKIAKIKIDSSIIERPFDQRQSKINLLWVYRKAFYLSSIAFKDELNFFEKEFLEDSEDQSIVPNSNLSEELDRGDEGNTIVRIGNRLTKSKTELVDIISEYNESRPRLPSEGILINSNEDDISVITNRRRESFNVNNALQDSIKNQTRLIKKLDVNFKITRQELIGESLSQGVSMQKILEEINGLKPPKKKSELRKITEETSTFIITNMFQNLGDYLRTGESPSFKDFSMLIAPALMKGCLDFYTGGIAGQFLGAFLSGYLKKEDPMMSKMNDFITNNFNVFKEEVMDHFSNIEKNQRELKENTLIIIEKISGRHNTIKDILKLEATKSKVNDLIFEKLQHYIDKLNFIKNERDIVNEQTYEAAIDLIKNYIEDISYIYALTFGAHNESLSNYLGSLILRPVAKSSGGNSLVFAFMEEASKRKGLISYSDAYYYLQAHSKYLNNFIVRVSEIVKEVESYLSYMYHNPSLINILENYTTYKKFKKKIFDLIESSHIEGLYDTNNYINESDIDSQLIDYIKPSIPVPNFLKNTFGVSFTSLINSINNTSIYHIWSDNKILQLKNSSQKVTFDEKVQYDTFYSSLYKGMGGESRLYSYKWLLNLKDNYLTIQLVGGTELKYLSVNSKEELVIIPLLVNEVPESYKWYISLKETNNSEGYVSYDQMDLVNGALPEIVIRSVSFYNFIPSLDGMDRELYKNKIKAYENPTTKDKKESLVEVSKQFPTWSKWNQIVHGIAFFDSKHNPVIYEKVLYSAVNEGSSSPSCIMLDNDMLKIQCWSKEKRIYEDLYTIPLKPQGSNSIDILCYQSIPLDAKIKNSKCKVKLNAYRIDDSGMFKHKGVNYSPVKSDVLDAISGDLYGRAYLFLDHTKTLKMVDANGKLVWYSSVKIKQDTIGEMLFNLKAKRYKLTGGSFGIFDSDKKLDSEKYYPSNNRISSIPDEAKEFIKSSKAYEGYFPLNLYDGTNWDLSSFFTSGDVWYTAFMGSLRAYFPISKDIDEKELLPVNLSLLHNKYSFEYITDIQVCKQKSHITLPLGDNLDNWSKLDVDINKGKDYGALYFFCRKSLFPLNYSDLIVRLGVDSKKDEKELWHHTKNYPKGYQLMKGVLNTGSGNKIRAYIRKVHESDFIYDEK